jgi:hypothetical protein
MRFPAVISCLVLGLLPQLGLAADPPGEVGALQAIYDFCTRADPSQIKDFERRADSLVRGLSPAQVAALRQGPAYKRGYDTLASVLPEVKGEDAVVACRTISGAVALPPESKGKEREEQKDREKGKERPL